jgi:hypothetical protein
MAELARRRFKRAAGSLVRVVPAWFAGAAAAVAAAAEHP